MAWAKVGYAIAASTIGRNIFPELENCHKMPDTRTGLF
jgi:hypothetical protein